MTASVDAPHLGLVVEGAGEREAVPVLLRNHMATTSDFADILGKPIPTNGKGNVSRDGGIEGFVATAAARPGCRAVMCFFDADKECAATVGPEWLARAATVTGVPVVVVLAEPNFEQWLYASVETLGLDAGYDEGRSGSSSIVAALKPVKYVKPTWQPRLTHRMDLSIAASRDKSLARALERFDGLRTLLT